MILLTKKISLGLNLHKRWNASQCLVLTHIKRCILYALVRDSSVESKRIKNPTENPTDNYVSIMKTLFALLNLRIRVTRTQYVKVIQNPNKKAFL